MTRGALAAGAAVLALAWTIAAARHGFSGHMTAHMAVVAIAAPLLAYGLAGSRLDPARRWPTVVAPLPMSLVELAVVWGWHLPAARAFAATGPAALALEQALFLAAGLLLWSACLGTRGAATSARRAAGVVALLLTTMHMTLLGVLITLAPRPLFGAAGSGWLPSPLADQQVGGVIMLAVGAGCYLIGGLVLLAALLGGVREPRRHAPWS